MYPPQNPTNPNRAYDSPQTFSAAGEPSVVTSEIEEELDHLARALAAVQEHLEVHAQRLNATVRRTRTCQAPPTASPDEEALSPLGSRVRTLRKVAERLIRESYDLNQDLAI